MDNSYKILEISENVSLKEVKKAYLDKVRVFSPEENPEEFIKIRKAYENILYKSKAENKIKESFFSITELIILENKQDEINRHIDLVKNEIDIENFKFVSDKLIDVILYCNKNNKRDIALRLIDEFVNEFEELNLSNLKKSYLLLRDSIEKRG